VAKKPRTPPPPRPVQKRDGGNRPIQAPQRRDTPKSGGGIERRWLYWGAAVVVAIGIAVGLGVAFAGGGSGKSASTTGAPIDWSAVPNLQTGPPPWGPDWQHLPDRLQVLGLSQLSQEGTVLHIHQYLALYVNGQRVTLPPDVGIYDNSFITELHVHVGEPNIIHVESPVQKSFDLGQIFGEWGIRLTKNCVGNYCGKLAWWVDGVKQKGDPALLVLKDHEVITITLGKPPAKIQTSFAFSKYGL